MRVIKGNLNGRAMRIGIVVAEFNEYFTEKLLAGTLDALKRFGVKTGNIEVIHVPGSFEIPFVIKRALKRKRFSAMIALGVILKGGTRHFKQVSDACARGTLEASLNNDIPVIHAVVTANTKAQAVERIGGKLGHRGRDAAKSALEMADVARQIS